MKTATKAILIGGGAIGVLAIAGAALAASKKAPPTEGVQTETTTLKVTVSGGSHIVYPPPPTAGAAPCASCLPAGSYAGAATEPAPCTSNSQCPSGYECLNGSCYPSGSVETTYTFSGKLTASLSVVPSGLGIDVLNATTGAIIGSVTTDSTGSFSGAFVLVGQPSTTQQIVFAFSGAAYGIYKLEPSSFTVSLLV